MGWVWRRRPVTCSANVGLTARSRAPSWVVTTTPSGFPITSPSANGRFIGLAPGARRAHSWFVGTDQRVPVGVPELAVATLGVQLLPCLARGGFDDRRQLPRELRVDRHVAHPFLVV